MKKTEKEWPSITEHAPNCEPWMEFQHEVLPGLPRIGRCVNCGAVEKLPAQRGAR